MADQHRPIKPERVQHVERMQGDVEHVAQALGPLGIAVSRQERREHMPAPGERCKKRTILGQPAGAVQEDQWPAFTRLEQTNLAAAPRDIEKVGASAHLAASTATGPGTARCGSGWIQKRASSS